MVIEHWYGFFNVILWVPRFIHEIHSEYHSYWLNKRPINVANQEHERQNFTLKNIVRQFKNANENISPVMDGCSEENVARESLQKNGSEKVRFPAQKFFSFLNRETRNLISNKNFEPFFRFLTSHSCERKNLYCFNYWKLPEKISL